MSVVALHMGAVSVLSGLQKDSMRKRKFVCVCIAVKESKLEGKERRERERSGRKERKEKKEERRNLCCLFSSSFLDFC